MAYSSLGTVVYVWCPNFGTAGGLLGSYRTIETSRKTDTTTLGSAGIGTLTAVSLDGISVAEIDVTSLQDTARQYINGSIEHGTLSMEYIAKTGKTFLGYLPTTASNFQNQFLKIAFGLAGEVFYVKANPQTFTMDAAVDDVVRGTITFRILDLGNHLIQSQGM